MVAMWVAEATWPNPAISFAHVYYMLTVYYLVTTVLTTNGYEAGHNIGIVSWAQGISQHSLCESNYAKHVILILSFFLSIPSLYAHFHFTCILLCGCYWKEASFSDKPS